MWAGRWSLANRSSLESPLAPPPWRHPLALTGLIIIGSWAVIGIFAPGIAPQNPLAQKFAILAGPSLAHWLGTLQPCADAFSPVFFGPGITPPLSVLLAFASI